jgi:cytochrome P450
MLYPWLFAGALGAFLVCLPIYRLFFHPLANIPGPKLCAITGWYEIFWDIVVGGQFTFKIEEWHKTYGPIMRIGPNEVHFNDPDFYNELYTTTAKYQKPVEWQYRFGFGSALFDTVDHEHHAKRRAPLAAFFSRSKILEFSPFIQEQTDVLVKRIQEYKGQVICANEAFDALTMDIIGYYAFGLSYHSVDYPKFHAPYNHVTEDVARMVHIGAHFPWVFTILRSIPQAIVAPLAPAMKKIFKFNDEIAAQIRRILKNRSNLDQEKHSHRTIFHEILNSKLEPSELTQERLQMEAGSLVGAALETSKMTTALAIYYILAQPDVEKKLREELKTFMPDPKKILTLPELEKLPYLAACVREALRLAIGVSQRIRRYNPHAPTHYKNYTIPPNTVFGMCHWEQLRDARIWHRPYEFLPERWLANNGNPMALNGQPLSQYFVPFHRGPRGCLGKEMGMAQLNIGLATLFRRVDHMELFETDQSAVDIVADYFVPLCVKGSKGVRVLIK